MKLIIAFSIMIIIAVILTIFMPDPFEPFDEDKK